jgi:hypothetical protein
VLELVVPIEPNIFCVAEIRVLISLESLVESFSSAKFFPGERRH